MKITKEMLDLAISLKACPEGIERAKLGFEFLAVGDKRWIAKQTKTPVEILEKLSADEGYWVRANVAYNPSTPVAILERLSTDEDSRVRIYVACNRSTPAAVLEKLSADGGYSIRCSVALHPDLNPRSNS